MTSAGDATARRTALYRLFDANDGLLYVGIGYDPGVRIAFHRNYKDWGGEITREQVEWFACRDDAESAELVAIRDEAPMHNIITGDSEGCARFLPRPDGGAWGRKAWTPTPEQEEFIVGMSAAFVEAEAFRAAGWAKIAEAVALGAPVERVPDFIPFSRATVIRKLKQLAETGTLTERKG